MCMALALIFVVGCTGNSKNVAMEYLDPGDKKTAQASMGLVSLWIGVQKDMGKDYLSYVDQSDDGWNLVLDEENGTTFKELYKQECVSSLKNLLAVEYLHDYVYGIELSDEQQKSVEKKISSVASSFGSQKAFEQEMQKYGASVDDYERYLCLMLKQSTLINSFYGENGMRAITEEKKAEYFSDKYAVVYHIFIDTRGNIKDDGTVVSLTEQEKQLKAEHAMDIYTKIKNGEISFEESLLLYTEDAYAASHANGYFVTNDGTYPTEFVDGAFSLAVGEITMVQSSAGYHIIKRYPMNESFYDDDEDVYTSITQNLISTDFSGLVSSVIDGVKVNDEVIAQLDASLIKSFAGF